MILLPISASGSKPPITTSSTPFKTPYPGYNGTIPTDVPGPTTTLRPPDFQFVTPSMRPTLFPGETPSPKPYCDIPLGVANPLVVSDSQLSASTSYNFSLRQHMVVLMELLMPVELVLGFQGTAGNKSFHFVKGHQ